MSQLSMFSQEEHPAKPSALRASEEEWRTSVATSRLSIAAWLGASAPQGWFGRTSPEFFPSTKAQPSKASYQPSQGGLFPSPQEGGRILESSPPPQAEETTGWRGECLTLSLSEHTAIPGQFPNDAGVCGLSDILETGDVPPQYFLSALASRGILNRADRRGKNMPELLALALEDSAQE